MAVAHSAAISSDNAAGALQTALVKKYGGYTAADLPDSPTWRIQADGTIQTGDSCSRRAVFGGLAKAEPSAVARPNLALKTTPDEFRFQIDRCGVAIITEDLASFSSAGTAAIASMKHIREVNGNNLRIMKNGAGAVSVCPVSLSGHLEVHFQGELNVSCWL